jgi:hypothetical protein
VTITKMRPDKTQIQYFERNSKQSVNKHEKKLKGNIMKYWLFNGKETLLSKEKVA